MQYLLDMLIRRFDYVLHSATAGTKWTVLVLAQCYFWAADILVTK
jgi:hypothetical protein